MGNGGHAYLSSYPGYLREPHSKSVGNGGHAYLSSYPGFFLGASLTVSGEWWPCIPVKLPWVFPGAYLSSYPGYFREPHWKSVGNGGHAYLSSYPGFFQEPYWLSMGLLEISRVTWQVCHVWSSLSLGTLMLSSGVWTLPRILCCQLESQQQSPTVNRSVSTLWLIVAEGLIKDVYLRWTHKEVCFRYDMVNFSPNTHSRHSIAC